MSKKQLLFKAFKLSIPVLLAYIPIGIAFGLLCIKSGINILFIVMCSAFILAGSMQFVLIGLLTGGASLLSIAVSSLSVNSRHIFYGLSFLKIFPKMKKAYPYMVFALTDENYSLLTSLEEKKAEYSERDLNTLRFYVAAINHSYWILSSLLGGLVGIMIGSANLDKLDGLEFAMTALFTVIAVEQWIEHKDKFPSILGVLTGIVFILVFKLSVVVAIIAAFLVLLFYKSTYEMKSR